ncbi:aminotransferase class I/II-fold pyridoxal phosphate-dependent enzyme [Sandaracinobacteroides hominis]|uniref:aminotransferase class I/II-fold pyridoxal phosphate-dependent enzyme n=1 Tax=Sandaracinobacteroides hominis TaxID=2780086 RepID=UPI001F35C3BF|nr:aminotransferase class I/II-fold pyridoxal phosphate-dependent enzyme [Sandaracinobacteroides hominis]
MMQEKLHGLWQHGGRIDEAARLFPAAPTPWLDLSTGINPVAWAPRAPLEVNSGPLPTTDALRSLEAAAADWFQTQPEHVAAVPGTDLAIRLLPTWLNGAAIVAASPGYATHLQVASGRVASSALDSADLPDGALLFANPSNPEGRMLPAARILSMSAHLDRRNRWMIVDEAFADAMGEGSILPHLKGGEAVIVLRSFGKFFGLAGLRLGFVIGPPVLVAAVRRTFGDWPVSAQAIAWGTAAYRDRAWADAARRRLKEQAAALDARLARHGLKAEGSCPLFRLVQDCPAGKIFLGLAGAGILVRPFADNPRWLRFGLPADDAALDRLDRALSLG